VKLLPPIAILCHNNRSEPNGKYLIDLELEYHFAQLSDFSQMKLGLILLTELSRVGALPGSAGWIRLTWRFSKTGLTDLGHLC
jgi:hypothetical protein